MKEKYPWLEADDERKTMFREILDKYVDLKNLVCQMQKRSKSWICDINIRMHLV